MALFRRLDKNDNGSLSTAELKPLSKGMGISAKALMNAMDKDGNRRITFNEFRKYMKKN